MPDRCLVERRPPARTERLVTFAALLFTIGCGGSLSGGTGGSGGAGGTGGAIGAGGSIGGGGGSACSQSTQPAGLCCTPAVQDPLTYPYVCDEGAGAWVCPRNGVPATPSGCTIAGTGGAATGGNMGSGGGAMGGNVGSGSGGSMGSGGGGGSNACPKTQPSSVCCWALVDHDPATRPYICSSTGTWVCPAGAIQEPSISGCIVSGTGGGGGIGGRTGSGGVGGDVGGRGGAGGSAKVCGGIAGVTCAPVEFCDFGNGQCGAGDQQGQCELSGGALCLQQVACGCDGHTYSSACAAHANGVDTMSTTSCIPGNGGTGAPCGQDTDCMSGYKCCVTGGTAGSPIACRQIPAGGSCPALP
jgi:hypothetical protein